MHRLRLPVGNHDLAVHQQPANPGRSLERLVIRRAIFQLLWIEDHQIGGQAFAEESPLPTPPVATVEGDRA